MTIKVTYNSEGVTYITVGYSSGTGGNSVWGDIIGTLSDQADLQAALDAKFDDPTGTTLQYIDGTGGLQTFPLTLPVLQQVRNQTGSSVPAGTVVYINGATGNLPTIALAIATGDATSAQTLGMVQTAIANNGTGYVVVIGTCGGLNTSSYTEGQQLYLSPSVAGGVTTTKPYAPQHLVYVGIVTRSHPTLGTIEVRVQNGFELSELHDVDALNANNNDGIFYNSSTSLWEHKTVPQVLGYTPEQPLTFSSPLSRATNTISIPQATGLVSGFLSATDWTTFNNKQNALVNPVTGTGTTNYLPKFTGASTLGNSLLIQGGTNAIGLDVTPSAWGSNLRVLQVGPRTALWDSNGGSLFSYNTYSDGTNSRYLITGAWARRYSINDGGHFWQIAPVGTAGDVVTFTEAARINFTGNFIINNSSTDNGARLQVSGTSTFSDSIGVGSAISAFEGISLRKNLTGLTLAFGVISAGQVLSDVTTGAYYFQTGARTQAASFTLSNLYHYDAAQGTFGIGSNVTNQYGFSVQSNLTGATNNYGFYGNIASGTGRWNLYMNGTANNYLAGSLGIGSTSLTGYNISIQKTLTGLPSGVHSLYQNSSVQSDVTGTANGISSFTGISSTTNLSTLRHFVAAQGTFSGGGTVTTQIGYAAASTLTSATNNYGFYGDIASGTGRWNLYMSGSANNHMAGNLLLGSTTDGGQRLQVTGTSTFSDSVGIGIAALTGTSLRLSQSITGSVEGFGVRNDGTIQTDVTTSYFGFHSRPQISASAFTLPALYHYNAREGTSFAGSAATITNQYGYYVFPLTKATNNYGFYGNIASGTGRWNLYMNGSAANFLNSKLLIGYAVDQSVSSVSSALQISGTTNDSTTAHIIRNSNDAVGSVMRLAKTRSTTNGGLTVVQDGDRIGSIAFAYTDGSAFRPASAVIGAEVDGTSISNVNSPGRLVFYTTPSGSTNSLERMRLNNAGNLLLGSAVDGGQRLQVTGTSNFTGDSTFGSSVTATQFRLSALNTAPATASSTGTLGEIRIDANYIYICTATNTWKRVAIATW